MTDERKRESKRFEGTLSLDIDKQDRTHREGESREAKSRPTDSYVPASQLPMPNKEDGYRHRYIRVSNLDKADIKNVSRRFREGWVPVVAKDYPELDVMCDLESRWPEGVEIGGLLLCKIPTEVVEARMKYNRDLATQQMESIDHGFMRDQDPRMPKHNDSTSRTSFRKG